MGSTENDGPENDGPNNISMLRDAWSLGCEGCHCIIVSYLYSAYDTSVSVSVCPCSEQ